MGFLNARAAGRRRVAIDTDCLIYLLEDGPQPRLTEAAAELFGLVESGGLRGEELPRPDPRRGQRECRRTNARVVATALMHRCDGLVTNDAAVHGLVKLPVVPLLGGGK